MNREEPILDETYYHIYNRGNRKQNIFGDDSDYNNFLNKLKTGCTTCAVNMFAHCLMPNHFHLLLAQAPGGSIPLFMDAVSTSAAKRYNLKYGEVGHLFQGHYRYNRIDSFESLMNVVRYIHLNPVAAGLVLRPEDWPYSDFVAWAQEKGVLLPGSNKEEGHLLPGLSRGAAYIESIREYQRDQIETVRFQMFADDEEFRGAGK